MRVLGVDPGLTRCGIGVVEGRPGRQLNAVAVDVVRTPADLTTAERLVRIELVLTEWIERHCHVSVTADRVNQLGSGGNSAKKSGIEFTRCGRSTGRS